jgi:hypothetical protein
MSPNFNKMIGILPISEMDKVTKLDLTKLERDIL